MVDAILTKYGCYHPGDVMPPEWAALEEFALRPGGGGRRIDLFLVRAWSGRPGHQRHAIEVKVSRTDLRKELDAPEKRREFVEHSHRFYFATPPGLFKEDELPPECGLYEVHDDGTVKLRKQAPLRTEPKVLPHATFVEAFRRGGRAEARIRVARLEAAGGGDADVGAQMVALRKDLAAARNQLSAQKEANRRTSDRLQELLRVVTHTHLAGIVCECGVPIEPRARARRGGWLSWVHIGDPGPHPLLAARDPGALCMRAAPDLAALTALHFPSIAVE